MRVGHLRYSWYNEMDPFCSNSQIEELENFRTLEENEVSYDDESFEQLLNTGYDF